jgi:Transposase
LLRRSENLGAEQHFRVRDFLRYNLKTIRAYLLKEAFRQLYEYSSRAWTGKFLDERCRQTMRSRIEPMQKITRSLRNHRRTHFEMHSQSATTPHRRVPQPTLDPRQVGTIQIRGLGHPFLGPAFVIPQLTYPFLKGF